MGTPAMTAIVAMTPSRVIGANGRLPWHFSEDLKFFKRTTLGHIVLMGRATFDSIGRPLPGRENWVLTRGVPIPGTRTFDSPAHIHEPTDGRTLFLVGGASVYRQLLSRCDEFLLTRILEEFPGDTYFPEFESEFTLQGVIAEYPGLRIERLVRASRP